MATTPSNPPQESPTNSTPLLGNNADHRRNGTRLSGLGGAARFLRQASSGRLMREPSVVVREAATAQLEERRSNWAYSKPVVVLDMMWNLASVAAAGVVLVVSRKEKPSVPVRLWILGYAFQCVVHMVCVGLECWRRAVVEGRGGGRSGGRVGSSYGPENAEEDGRNEVEQDQDRESTSVAKHLESANTMFSFVWWIIGFYWVSAGGQALTHEAPHLYWLALVFLAFDVIFVIFCVALACIVGIAVCCCLPCMIAILYAVTDQEGATEEDIHQLPKYKFRRTGDFCELNDKISVPLGGVMIECAAETPNEHVLSAEDAQCCICLSAYDDGAELRELPCNHHFHCTCIDKWLHINATCPLCKHNILKSGNRVQEDV